MKIGDTVSWDGKDWKIKYIEDRNTYEGIPHVKLMGNVVVLVDDTGNKTEVYDFDL